MSSLLEFGQVAWQRPQSMEIVLEGHGIGHASRSQNPSLLGPCPPARSAVRRCESGSGPGSEAGNEMISVSKRLFREANPNSIENKGRLEDQTHPKPLSKATQNWLTHVLCKRYTDFWRKPNQLIYNQSFTNMLRNIIFKSWFCVEVFHSLVESMNFIVWNTCPVNSSVCDLAFECEMPKVLDMHTVASQQRPVL